MVFIVEENFNEVKTKKNLNEYLWIEVIILYESALLFLLVLVCRISVFISIIV